MFKVPEKYRVRTGRMGSDSKLGNNGYFCIPNAVTKPRALLIIASDGESWEHVSLHVEYLLDNWSRNPVMSYTYTPYWNEMQLVKDTFWSPEDTVVQFHPALSNYINAHPNVLHLWRPCGGWDKLQMPPLYLV